MAGEAETEAAGGGGMSGGAGGGGPTLLIVTGEASGDLHAGHLLSAIRRAAPGTRAFGIGGATLEAAGCELVRRIDEMQVMGFVEVLGAIPRLRRIQREILARCRSERPDAAILVDYPGFNLNIARKLKRLGIPVIYYISPQIWAWWPSRVKKMRGVVDLMLVLFGFETEVYESAGVPVKWVGHPLVDAARDWPSRAEARERLGVGEETRVVALLPGSRPQEIGRHLATFAAGAAKIAEGLDGAEVRVVAAEAESLPEGTITGALGDSSGVEVVRGGAPAVMRAADVAVVASGTATLETALAGTPMVVCYRTSFLTYLGAKLLISVPYIALVNVVAGRGVVPELIQGDMTPDRISEEALRILRDAALRARQIEGLAGVAHRLGEPGGSERAAAAVVDFLARRQKG